MKKITELTAEQEKMLDVYRDKWIAVGLATEPVDMAAATAAICSAYRSADLPAPTRFYKAASPVSAIALIKEIALADGTKMTDSEILSEMFYGNHDANWLGFYQYFRDVLNIEECHKLDGLIDLASHCGWLSAYEDVVVFQDRPEYIKFDEVERLHCEDGPAIRYRDGYSIYSWHGTRIPEEWITKKAELAAVTALTWENVEQRRCACEILGWARVLRELDATVIDADEDPMIGTLVEVQLPDFDDREKFLKVVCATGREFAMPVPPEMTTALEANAWTYDLKPGEYNIEVRT